VIHKGPDCDVYQAECKRLRSAYDALACRYRSLQIVDDPADIERTHSARLRNAPNRTNAKFAVPTDQKVGDQLGTTRYARS
jgi:hypothetical protein